MVTQLLLCKRLFLEASEYASRTDPVSCGLAVSLLQDSIEMLVWALIKEKNVSVKDGAGFLSNLESLQKHGVSLTDVPRLQELNKARVGFKHYGNLPAPTEARKFKVYAEGFIRATLTTHFHQNFDALSLVDLVPFQEINARLRVSEGHIAKQEFRESVRENSIAKVELFWKLNDLVPKVDPNLGRADRLYGHMTGSGAFGYLEQYLETMREAVLVAMLRLPPQEFAFLNATTYHANRSMAGDWRTTDTYGRLPDEATCRRQIACLVDIAIGIHGATGGS